MGTAQRIKGQEVAVLITTAGVLEAELTDVRDFDATAMLTVISKGYLGEPTERKDEIYKGIKFKMTLHLHSTDFSLFQQKIIARAKRTEPDLVFNITGVFTFPNGQSLQKLIPDCFFDSQDMTVKSNGDYVEVTVPGEASDFVDQAA